MLSGETQTESMETFVYSNGEQDSSLKREGNGIGCFGRAVLRDVSTKAFKVELKKMTYMMHLN